MEVKSFSTQMRAYETVERDNHNRVVEQEATVATLPKVTDSPPPFKAAG